MSRESTHTIRSHRSKRTYKPVNKTMRHKEAKSRKSRRKLLAGMEFMNSLPRR